MADEIQPGTPRLTRFPTGIPGLDTITLGGLFAGDMYLLEGGPGTGKTVLGNQLCFDHVSRGGRAAFVTLVAETHGRMLEHLRSFSFFKSDVIGEPFQYFSGLAALDQQGSDTLRDELTRTVREKRISLLVIDGLVAIADRATPLTFCRFVLDLHALAEMTGCTTVLMTAFPERCQSAEGIVDGLIVLSDETVGLRTERQIQIHKLRGSAYLSGVHVFTIDDTGLVIFPLTEKRLGLQPPPEVESPRQVSLGMPRFDAAMEGGPDAASSTLILGTPGGGKTSIGLSFLAAGARNDERGLFFGFDEAPPRLVDKADRLGFAFSTWTASGAIDFTWTAPNGNRNLDQLAESLLNTIRQRQIRRLVIDNLNGFTLLALHPERFGRYLTAVTNELRGLGVTTIMTMETAHIFGPSIDVPIPGLSALVDNIVFVRYVEVHSTLRHLISILKMRQSDFDPTIRELLFSAHGVDVGGPLEGVLGVMTGIGMPAGGNIASSQVSPRRKPRT